MTATITPPESNSPAARPAQPPAPTALAASAADAATSELPETPPPARTMRILPIRANLLPEEIINSRREGKVRRRVVTALAMFTALLVAWYGVATYEASLAKDDLVAAEDDTRSLTRQQNAFSELVKTQTESKAITSQLQTLLANDLRWSTLLASLQSAAPAGVKVTGVTGALAAEKDAKQASGGPVGTLTITGAAPSKDALAAYVDALAKVSGFANPFPTDASEQDARVEFTVRLDITEAALGGRYTPASPSPSGSK